MMTFRFEANMQKLRIRATAMAVLIIFVSIAAWMPIFRALRDMPWQYVGQEYREHWQLLRMIWAALMTGEKQ
jgi:hypothetical protein